MQFHFHVNQSHFHKNGFALRLALKQRHKRTRKWPIEAGARLNFKGKSPGNEVGFLSERSIIQHHNSESSYGFGRCDVYFTGTNNNKFVAHETMLFQSIIFPSIRNVQQTRRRNRDGIYGHSPPFLLRFLPQIMHRARAWY